MRTTLSSPRSRITGRGYVGLLILLAAFVSWQYLHLSPGDLWPSSAGVELGARFLARAISPALTYESEAPPWTSPLIWKALAAAHDTILFAAAAMSGALIGGAILAFIGSSAWWAADPAAQMRPLARVTSFSVYGCTRLLIAFLRSIHELLWAVLLLAAFGRGQLTAVMALMIPYTGVLAKVFSEMIDEAPRDAAIALREAGASPLQVFFFGLVPRALPDITTYAFYRFECAVRSSAILGFFGFPTLGYYISASFENLYFGEVWTYLYVLFALVALLDWWSGAIRRRFVA